MSSIYSIKSTDGQKTISIKPGQINAVGNVTHDYDLKLHGYGSTQWGSGVNENFIRIIENFAVEQKEPTDVGYDPAKLKPKDYGDLGLGLGINKPTIGQIWFNKTDNSLYVYTLDDSNNLIWKSISFKSGGDMPTTPNVGDMWFDADNSTSSSCITTPVLKIYNPTHPNNENGWTMVVDDAVKKCGDTMTGELIMSSGTKITITDAPVDDTDAVNKLYVDAIGDSSDNHISDFSVHLTPAQNTLLDNLNLIDPIELAYSINSLSNIPSGWDTFSEIDGKVNKSGDTMGGFLFLHQNPTLAMHAATKQYVDTQTGAGAGNAINNVRYFDTLAPYGFPNARDGDMATVAGIIYVMMAGTWRQIWPAQYST